MDLTKQDIKCTQGLAIIFMVILHLFCKKINLPYSVVFTMPGSGVPVFYYLALFCDSCVVIYCFCSGYAHYTIKRVNKDRFFLTQVRRLLKFLLRYWLIVILFVLVGVIRADNSIPGSFTDFLGNMLLYDITYNGSWWFVQTYTLILLLSPIIFLLAENLPKLSLLIGIIIYVFAYFIRFQIIVFSTDIHCLRSIIYYSSLLGTSIFPYIIGMLFAKDNTLLKIKEFLDIHINAQIQTYLFLLMTLVMIIFHGIVESLFVAPLTGVFTICMFNIWLKKKVGSSIARRIFFFMGRHSTNIWLIHMFFFGSLFNGFVYRAEYPVFIFALLVLIVIPVSWLINIVYDNFLNILKLNN